MNGTCENTNMLLECKEKGERENGNFGRAIGLKHSQMNLKHQNHYKMCIQNQYKENQTSEYTEN